MKKYFLITLLLISGNINSQTSFSPQTWFKANSGVYGLFLWYYQAFHNTEVMLWQDNSSNTWDAAGYSSIFNDCTPNYKNSTATDINYNPCIYFDGDDNYLNLSSNYPTSTDDGITYFIVAKPDLTSKTEAFLFDFGNFTLKGYGLTHSSNNTLFYSSTNSSMGGASTNHSHSMGTSPVILRYEIEFGVEQRIFYQGEYTASEVESISLPSMALQNISSHASNAASKGPFTIGRQSKTNGLSYNNIRAYQGYIMEIIGFDELLSSQDVRTIETYLALKYGIDIDNAGYNTGQPLLNYRASDGTNLYSVYADPDYYHDIIGIGRDDETNLMQKQSHTSSDDFRIYLSSLASNNANNSGSFTSNSNPNNIQFLVSGNNQGAMYATAQCLQELPTGLHSRVEREWKLENSNFTGSFNIDLELGNYAINSGVNLTDLRLLIDTDGDFSNATAFSTADGISFVLNGNTLSILNIQNTIIPKDATIFFTLGSIGIGTPLNVDLAYFTAQESFNSQEILLSWKTWTEKDIEYFLLEKSTDGKTWNFLTQLKGSGTSTDTQYYNYTDNKVNHGTTFYRLSHINFDGKVEELSNTIIKVKETEIVLSPNPAQDYLIIHHPDQTIQQLEIYSSSGHNLPITEKFQINNFKTRIEIRNLKPGIYTLRIDEKLLRFVKQ